MRPPVKFLKLISFSMLRSISHVKSVKNPASDGNSGYTIAESYNEIPADISLRV
jgi:hypothetical protein